MTAKPLRKEAFMGSAAGAGVRAAMKPTIGTLLGQAAVMGLATLGAEAIYNLGKRSWQALQHNSNYRRMLAANPDLRKADAQTVMDRFRILSKYGPTLAEDPIVAGHWIKQTLEYPVVSPTVLKDVVEVEEKARGLRGFGAAETLPKAISGHISRGLFDLEPLKAPKEEDALALTGSLPEKE